MNVSLTPRLQQYVRKKVRSGRYESASEVIRDSLRALQQRERGEEEFWRDARRKVAEAREDVAAGRTVDGESAMAEIIAEIGNGKSQSRRKRRVIR